MEEKEPGGDTKEGDGVAPLSYHVIGRAIGGPYVWFCLQISLTQGHGCLFEHTVLAPE
jgi:hypothetical protein